MTKEKLKSIAQKYGMEILRDPITQQAWGRGLETAEDIAELDDIVAFKGGILAGTKEYGAYQAVNGTHYYKIVCPKSWFDLWGWK